MYELLALSKDIIIIASFSGRGSCGDCPHPPPPPTTTTTALPLDETVRANHKSMVHVYGGMALCMHSLPPPPPPPKNTSPKAVQITSLWHTNRVINERRAQGGGDDQKLDNVVFWSI